ncbi:MAG: hypothetical protein HYV07_10160 [Deltaproteobacteria bacterium]|nr:hypothetical protein [Deltaproteobacteria bacterium]
MSNKSSIFAGLGALLAATPASALTLSPGVLRIDVGLADHSIIDSGTLGGGSLPRGLTFLKIDGIRTLGVSLGIGGAYGIMDNLEIGTLLIPLGISPEGGFGDMQLYGRYRFLSGDFSAAAQLTIQIPTSSVFGLGFGLPISAMLGPDLKLLSGVELEVVFASPSALVNLDLPVTFLAKVAETARLGVRTGLFMADLDTDGVSVPLGVLVEIDAGPATIVPAFVWPYFLNSTGATLGTFLVNLGARFEFDVQGGGGAPPAENE